MFGSLLPPVVNKRALYLIYFNCVYLRIVVSNIYCVVLCFAFLRLVYLMLPVSLDCQFLIAPSVFSHVYLLKQPFNFSFKSASRNGTQQKAPQLQLNNLISFFVIMSTNTVA